MPDYLEIATQHHWSTPQSERDLFGSNLGPRYDLSSAPLSEGMKPGGLAAGAVGAEVLGALSLTQIAVGVVVVCAVGYGVYRLAKWLNE